MKIGFINSYQNFPETVFLGLIWLIEFIYPFDFLKLMDILEIFIWTIAGIYVVNLDGLFL